jgi:hypothetical protein
MEQAYTEADHQRREQIFQQIRKQFPGGEKGFRDFVYKFIDGLKDPDKGQFAKSSLIMSGSLALP